MAFGFFSRPSSALPLAPWLSLSSSNIFYKVSLASRFLSGTTHIVQCHENWHGRQCCRVTQNNFNLHTEIPFINQFFTIFQNTLKRNEKELYFMDNRASMTCGLGLITLQFATYETLCLCLEQILPVAKPVAGLWRSTCKPHSSGLYWFELFVSAHFGCFSCFLFSFQFQLFGSRWQALSKIVVSFTRFFYICSTLTH